MFVEPTGVNPVGMVFQPVGGVTFDGMQPTVICPKVRPTFAVWGLRSDWVFWFTCESDAAEGAPTLTSVQVPMFVAPLNMWRTTQELMVPVQALPEPTWAVE